MTPTSSAAVASQRAASPFVHGHSDIDLLIVEPVVVDRFEKMIRLNRALKGLVMPVDLLVVSEQECEQRPATFGTVEHTARREGRVLSAA
jgi:hypothetical protein